jgi:hypothetical protein
MIQVAGNVSSSFHDHMGSGEWVFFFSRIKKKNQTISTFRGYMINAYGRNPLHSFSVVVSIPY